MSKHLFVLGLIMILFLPVSFVYAQNFPSDKIVTWESIKGKDGEFVVAFPKEFGVISDRDIFIGRKLAHASKKITTYRYINGTILLLEYYEGNGQGIFDGLVERHSETPVRNEKVNDFQLIEYSGALGKYHQREELYRYKSRAYVVKGISKSADDPILTDFFSSVSLVTKKASIFPNLLADVKSPAIHNIHEQMITSDDPVIYKENEVDRKPIILYFPKLRNRLNLDLSDFSSKIELVLSPTGKVTSVKMLKGGSSAYGKAYKEAAQEIVFIPAEKDGKRVFVSKVIEQLISARPATIQ